LRFASRIFASIGNFIRREAVAAWPVFLFFMIGFLVLLLLIKLALANFSVEMSALSKAVVGALFAAKAALILDETPLAQRLKNYHRRIVAVAAKTVFYGVVTLLLGYVERILDALHRVHKLGLAVQYVIAHGNMYRLLGWALGISIVFAIYFVFLEISERMGEGELWRLFLERPRNAQLIASQ
jgi:hypothetical protein